MLHFNHAQPASFTRLTRKQRLLLVCITPTLDPLYPRLKSTLLKTERYRRCIRKEDAPKDRYQ